MQRKWLLLTAATLTGIWLMNRAMAKAPAAPAPYIHWLASRAREMTIKTGIPASWAIGQSCLETNFGASNLAQNARNLFAIRAIGGHSRFWPGEYMTLANNGNFRKYPTYRDSLFDYATLFYRVAAYADALAYRADPVEFGRLISPIYAPRSDGNQGYFEHVLRIMSQYNLMQYDVPPDAWKLDPGLIGQQYVTTWKSAIGVPA